MINTLFKSKISRKSVQQPASEERIPKTIEIKSITHGERAGRGPTALLPDAGGRGAEPGPGSGLRGQLSRTPVAPRLSS